jgi:hypothetical protein
MKETKNRLLHINWAEFKKDSVRFVIVVSVAIIIVLLIFSSYIVLVDQNIAMSIVEQDKTNYFKNVLGRDYNYTDLITFENQHLNFTNDPIERNTDPVKIYEYGKGRCGEFAILYSALCVSQGYRCRVVDCLFTDHEFNEIYLNETWVRVDASLNSTDSVAIGYPMFFEDGVSRDWKVPVLALAFEGSSIADVTSTYRRDGLSPIVILATVILLVLPLSILLKLRYSNVKGRPNRLEAVTFYQAFVLIPALLSVKKVLLQTFYP